VQIRNQRHQINSVLLTGAALLCLVALEATPLNADAEIKLSDRCPPYFSLSQGNLCRLNTLYDLYPAANPQWGGYRVALPSRRDGFTPQQIDLGRYLFFDSILSADRDLSCAHCHHPDFSLSDGRERSIGRHGQGFGPARSGGSELPRAAPALWNMTFQQQFFWDGRAASLEQQIETVLTTREEMATNPGQLVASINAIPAYRSLFLAAFATEQIEFAQILTAIVAFETSLVSLNSAYDRYIHGARDALNEQEINGLNIFRSFASRCSQCHTPPLFTSGQIVTTGVPEAAGFPFDVGAEAVTGEPSLRGAFKVPTLRNIARSEPFMHAGQAKTLLDAVDFYNHAPGHAVSDRSDLTLHWHVVDPQLRTDEMVDLVAFLHTLTDETAMPVIPDRVPSGLPVPR
jgi:cytochrome c peroxidase